MTQVTLTVAGLFNREDVIAKVHPLDFQRLYGDTEKNELVTLTAEGRTASGHAAQDADIAEGTVKLSPKTTVNLRVSPDAKITMTQYVYPKP